MTILLAIAVLTGQDSRPRTEPWYVKAVAGLDVKARKDFPWSSRTNAIIGGPTVNADPTLYIFDGTKTRPMTEAEGAAYQARMKRNGERTSRARALLQSLALTEARSALEELMREDDMQFSASLMLAEVAAFERRHDEALMLLGPFVNEGLQEEGLLIVAVAAANRGRAYEGQDKFCEVGIRRSTYTFTHDVVSFAKSHVALAELGLANSYSATGQDNLAATYLWRVLAREPSNAVANFLLGIILEARLANDLALQKYELAAAFGSPATKEVAESRATSLRNRIGVLEEPRPGH